MSRCRSLRLFDLFITGAIFRAKASFLYIKFYLVVVSVFKGTVRGNYPGAFVVSIVQLLLFILISETSYVPATPVHKRAESIFGSLICNNE
jgi:hypothetical protein